MPGRLAAAVGEDLPAQRLARPRHPLGVDGDDDALRAELLGALGHELPAVHGGGVDRDLVGAGLQQLADVLDRAHAAADGERHEAALGRALDDVEDGVAVLVAGRDVEEAQLVGAGRVVGGGRLDGIAGVDEVDEVDALDDAAVLDVEAGNDADLEHGTCIVAAGSVGEVARSVARPEQSISSPAMLTKRRWHRTYALRCPEARRATGSPLSARGKLRLGAIVPEMRVSYSSSRRLGPTISADRPCRRA